MLSRGARLARQHGASRLARRLTSRTGPNDAALARAPPVLREYLSRPVVLRPVSKAAWGAFESEGMEKVLGIGPEVLEELRLGVDYLCMEEDDWRMRASLEHAEKKLESWGGITKGRDIFIPGMKAFDIMQAYAQLVPPVNEDEEGEDEHWEEYENEYEYEVESENEYEYESEKYRLVRTAVGYVGSSFYLPNWLVSAGELQAVGHFPALRHGQRKYIGEILAFDSQNPARQHLIAHHEWWNNDENANALDELKRVAVWYDHGSSRWARDWPEGGEKLKPPILLRRLREAEARWRLSPVDIHFAHLDCIADPPAEGKLALRVLRRSHHVAHVAKKLRNCASSYIGRVKRGRYVLVGAFDGEKPKALAGYAAGGAGWNHRPVFFGNKNVDGGTRALFDAFLPALETWTPAAPSLKDENGDDWNEHEEYEEDDEDDSYTLFRTRSHPDTPYCARYKKERI